jgi:hypothetical protein
MSAGNSGQRWIIPENLVGKTIFMTPTIIVYLSDSMPTEFDNVPAGSGKT